MWKDFPPSFDLIPENWKAFWSWKKKAERIRNGSYVTCTFPYKNPSWVFKSLILVRKPVSHHYMIIQFVHRDELKNICPQKFRSFGHYILKIPRLFSEDSLRKRGKSAHPSKRSSFQNDLRSHSRGRSSIFVSWDIRNASETLLQKSRERVFVLRTLDGPIDPTSAGNPWMTHNFTSLYLLHQFHVLPNFRPSADNGRRCWNQPKLSRKGPILVRSQIPDLDRKSGQDVVWPENRNIFIFAEFSNRKTQAYRWKRLFRYFYDVTVRKQVEKVLDRVTRECEPSA